MTLRLRINVVILLLFVLVLLGGGSYVISNARQAVERDMQWAADLSRQLIENILANSSDNRNLGQRIQQQLSGLSIARHLKIAALQPGYDPEGHPLHNDTLISPDAPGWFTRLVQPPSLHLHRRISGPDTRGMELVVWTDPSARITEIWKETRNILLVLLVFTLLIILLVYISLGRGLAPIDTVIKGLGEVEQGNYDLRLPRFALPELNRISEQFNRMVGELRRGRETKRYLTQRSLAIQEEERRSLAREMHDELGQTLSAIKALAVSIKRNTPEVTPNLGDNADTIIHSAERLYGVTRNMMQRLHPHVLDELGLVSALEDMVNAWNERQDIVYCDFHSNIDGQSLDQETAINLYRIAQEGLTNIAKHSNASRASIRLSHHSQGLRMTISDNGNGFDPDIVRSGLGLRGMRERADFMGGEFELTYAGGVSITVLIPIQAAA